MVVEYVVGEVVSTRESLLQSLPSVKLQYSKKELNHKHIGSFSISNGSF